MSPRQLAAQATAILELAYLASGRQLAVVCGEGVLRIADAATGKNLQVIELSGSPGTLAVNGDGQRIAVGGGDSLQGDVYIIECDTWTVSQLPLLPSRAHALRFGPDRLLLAGGGEDGPGYLSACDLTRVQHSDHRPVRWPSQAKDPQAADLVNLAVHDVSFSGDALFAVAADGLVWVGETDTGGLLCAVTDAGTPEAVAFSPTATGSTRPDMTGSGSGALTETERKGSDDIHKTAEPGKDPPITEGQLVGLFKTARDRPALPSVLADATAASAAVHATLNDVLTALATAGLTTLILTISSRMSSTR